MNLSARRDRLQMSAMGCLGTCHGAEDVVCAFGAGEDRVVRNADAAWVILARPLNLGSGSAQSR
jgi:hypothetical protein